MDRVNTAVNENTYRHRTHRVADIPRDNTSRHIRRTDVSVADKFDSTPEIDCFNNYSKTGQTAYSNTTQTANSSVAETSIFKHELYSIYTKPGVEVFVSNASHKPPIQFNRMFDPEIMRISEYMNQGIRDYMAGKVGADEITKIVENAYSDILAYNISLGNTDGTCPHYNARLLFDTQAYFTHRALGENHVANSEEGLAYAKEKYGMQSGQDNFTYYNAKYFFLNKELQEIGKSAIAQIAEKDGFEFYNVNGLEKHADIGVNCFNKGWQVRETSAKMFDTDFEPPKNFTMFFTPKRYSHDDWVNGKNVQIFADDPTKPSGDNATSYWLRVPRGWQLFKNVPLWAIQGTVTNQDGESFVNWDVSKHLNWQSGKDISTLLKEFFAEFVNNPVHGDLVIWSNGTRSDHDVLFCIFDDKRKFDGSELTAAVQHNEYVKNFEFRVF